MEKEGTIPFVIRSSGTNPTPEFRTFEDSRKYILPLEGNIVPLSGVRRLAITFRSLALDCCPARAGNREDLTALNLA